MHVDGDLCYLDLHVYTHCKASHSLHITGPSPCALPQFANWDLSLRTETYFSQFGNSLPGQNLSLQTDIDLEIMARSTVQG